MGPDMATNFNIEKLVGRENFSTWAFAIKNLLLHEDLWEAIEPPAAAASTTSSGSGNGANNVDPRKDAKAKAKIVLTIDTKLYIHVQNELTAKDTWNKLRKLFEDDGLDRRVGLVSQLINTKLSNSKSTEEYVTNVMTICHKLTNAGLIVSDEWTGIFMLAGLPETYRPMIMSMESSGKVITADMVKTKLLQDVKPVSNESDEVALIADKKFKKKNFKQKRYYGNQQSQYHSNNVNNCGNQSNQQNEYRNNNSNNRYNQGNKQTNYQKFNKGNAFCTILSVGGIDKNGWYLDSGASSHMTRNNSNMLNEETNRDVITIANNNSLLVKSSGLVKLNADVCGKESPINVYDVKYVPDLTTNLLSVSQMAQKGHTVIFKGNEAKVVNSSNDIIATAILDGGLYKLKEVSQGKTFVSHSNNDMELWHRRLAHVNCQSLNLLKQGMAKGINFNSKIMDTCVTCAEGKQQKQPFKNKGSRANELLELIHSDLCGPMETESFRASRYILTFKDDKSRKVFVYFLQNKTEVAEKFMEFKTLVEKQTGKHIKILRTDNGTEYVNKNFQDILKKHGIIHQTTVPYTPEQNGMAERTNRTILDKTRCLLFDAKLPKQYWAEAVNCAVYLMNRSPVNNLDKTPEEIWSGRKPSLAHLRIFGTKSMVHIPKQKRHKLDPKSEEYILVGYGTRTKGYRLYSPQTQKNYLQS